MGFDTYNGKPGVQAPVSATPKEVFYAGRERAQFIPVPVTVDGTRTKDATNTPYVWQVNAGQLMGKVTSGGKYASSVLGLTTAASLASATTVTVGLATAVEIVRRIGASGTFKLVGPPTAAGTNAVTTVTFSAVNVGTGAITCSAITPAVVSGALISPTDGSEVITTVVCDPYGIKTVDMYNTVNVDVFAAQLLNGGGVINVGQITNYPADTSIRTYIKNALRTACAGVTFSDDF